MSDPSRTAGTAPSIGSRLALLLPDAESRRAVLAALAESAREVHRLMPNSWGITLTDQFFRMNLGQVNVFIGTPHGVKLLVATEEALRAASADDEVRGMHYVNAPGCSVVSAALPRFSALHWSFRDAHLGALGAVKVPAGCTWPDSHSIKLIEYLAALDPLVVQPHYATDHAVRRAPAPSDGADLELAELSGRLGQEGARVFRMHQRRFFSK